MELARANTQSRTFFGTFQRTFWTESAKTKAATIGRGFCFYLLDQAGFFKGCIRSVLSNISQPLGGNVNCHVLVEFWHIDSLLLEIRLASYFSARVKLRRSSAVTITTPNLGFLSSDVAFLCHKSRYITMRFPFCNQNANVYHKVLWKP